MLMFCLCVCGKYFSKEVDWFENISTKVCFSVGNIEKSLSSVGVRNFGKS